MAELVKPWNDGGSLSVAYEGSGDGSAVFSSDVAEGLDREMIVVFRDGGRTVAVERKVLQVGMREMFVPNDGDFVPSEGGSFNVLKDGKAYTEIDYLQSTGYEHIDTLYYPNTKTEIEVKASGISADSFFNSSSGTWFFGGRKAYLNSMFGSYYNQSTKQLYFAFGNKMFYNSYTSMYGDNKVLKLNSTGMYVNGTKVVTITSNSFTSPATLTLFGLNNDGGVISKTAYKVHYCKIWDNGELVRDLIPVLDKDNVACMYDKVSCQFFYNQGTGNFIAGNKI